MSAHLPLKPHIPVACEQTPPPPHPSLQKKSDFSWGEGGLYTG